MVERSVWTFYWSFAHRPPAEMRQMLLDKDWDYWRDAILNDLARAHPDIRERVSRIDIMRIGHAMARPVPGFLGSESAGTIRGGTRRIRSITRIPISADFRFSKRHSIGA